jgi:hypothetical protein
MLPKHSVDELIAEKSHALKLTMDELSKITHERQTPLNDRTYAVGALMGGLEGQRPSKIRSFHLLWAALPPRVGEKEVLRGRLAAPAPPPRKSCE